MTVKLGYGLITCQRYPDSPPGWQDLYTEALELARLADEGGLDSVWVSEHHSFDDGYLPSVFAMLGALGAVTRRIAIGSAMLLAPLQHPHRIAEDAAVVDLISGGRLLLGLGLGWRDEEFEEFDVPKGKRVRALLDTISVCRRGWAGEPTRHSAERGDFAYVTPRPVRPQGPPIWIGARADDAIRRAARTGDGFMADSTSPEVFGAQVATLREEAARVGRDPDSIALSIHVATLVSDAADPWAEAVDALHYTTWKYNDQRNRFGAAGPLARPPKPDAERERDLRERSLVGSPATVAARIREYEAAAGDTPIHFVARSYFPGLGPAGRRAALESLLKVREHLNA
ncbi:LLM class flavin-dependent oxidoreductase [Dactylosporangium sp. NPDC005572]|uniref:LLM class flavin-dependent oxidoreductase n=1 Tax=Dactylosporangium sp. NPDC005572 TaxID=3156889 RepID=UPI00339E7DD6